jgi:hypothetical protein
MEVMGIALTLIDYIILIGGMFVASLATNIFNWIINRHFIANLEKLIAKMKKVKKNGARIH